MAAYFMLDNLSIDRGYLWLLKSITATLGTSSE